MARLKDTLAINFTNFKTEESFPILFVLCYKCNNFLFSKSRKFSSREEKTNDSKKMEEVVLEVDFNCGQDFFDHIEATVE